MKKNWNVAKIFTLLITVLFLASTLFVGCKEQEPEPGPEPSSVMYTVTYAVEGGGNSVTGIPEPKTVEKGTVLKVDDLPTLTEPEGWTFEGWYIGEEPFTSDYTVTSNIIITAKFVENVAPSLPEDPVDPDTTNNFNGNYYAGEDDMGYIEFTTETDCVVFVVSAVPAKYTVADNVATIKGVKVSNEEDYSAIEIKTTALANDSFSVTYPVEICKIFNPAASENMVITYTKTDKPSSEGGEGGTTPPADGEEDSTTPDTTNNFNGNYYAGKDGDTDFGYIEFTTETECVVYVVSEVPATYTVADNVATIKGVDYSEIEIKTTALANDSFSVTYPVEICKIFDPAASGDMVITYTKADKPSNEGGEGGVIPEPEPTVPTKYMVSYVTNPKDLQVENIPTNGEVEENKTIELPTLTLGGYTFDGWYDGDTKVESSYKVTKAVTLTAKFTKIVPVPTKYMVSYVTNPKDLQVENFPTNGEVEESKTIELPSLTLVGYTFDGWYDGETEVESPYKVTKAVTLTAKFTKIVPVPTKYMVSYVTNPEGLQVENFPTNGEVEENKTIELPSLTLEGYTFDGWYDGETEVESPYKVTKAVTLTAKFTKIVPVPTKYMVTYVTNPEDLQVENFPTNGEVEENKTIELPSLTLEGYTFNGWYDGETEVESSYKVTKAVTLTAKFTEIVPDTTNNFKENYYAGKYGDTDYGYIEFTNETDCVVFVVSEVYATYTVADNVATIKGVRIRDEEDYSAIEIKTTILANDSFSVTYPVEICKMFDPDASEDMVITYTKVDNPSSGGGGAVVVPDPVETFLVTYTVVGIDANLVTGLPETGNVNKDTVLSLSPLEAPEGYDFDGWFINDECVEQHTVVADVTIVAKFSEKAVVADNVYTITNVPDIWAEIEGNLYVYAFNGDDNAWFAATYENNTLKFESDTEYPTCIAVICDGEGDWSNVLVQSPNLNVSEKTAVLAFESLDGLFLRGTMNEWQQTSLTADPSCSTVYSVDFTGSNSTEFKIANGDWGTAYGGWHIKGINIDITGDDNAIVGLSEKDYTMYIFPCKIDNDKIYVYIK